MPNNKIPKIPHAFFKWYCAPHRYEELHGDLEELFYERVSSGLLRAKIKYTLDVIRGCRPYAWRGQREKQLLELPMLGNYFKVALRGMMKNPVNSFINIFGLSFAIGVCVLVFGYLQWDHDIDRFHKNADKVYLITYFGKQDGTMQQYGSTPRPLGEMLRNDAGGNYKACRVEDEEVIVKHSDNVFYERVRYADAEFLDMFTFPMKWGVPSSLSDLNSIIISEEMSIKYFGEGNPVGKDLQIKFGESNSKVFKVTGVAEKFPKAHDIDFNCLINFDNIRIAHPDYNANDWSRFLNATFIQPNDAGELRQIGAALNAYRLIQNEAQRDQAIDKFSFEPLATLHQRAGNIRNAIAHDDNLEGRIGLPIVALFMLALACFNYINIAIVSATRRLKEIGVRKVIGATRSRMVVQFLSENMITTLFALLLGFALSVTIFIPWFVQFSGGGMQFEVLDKNLILFLLGLLVITGVASGVYPAFYISKFDAVEIFKSSVKFGRRNPVTKIFLAIQMILACMLISSGVVFTQNNSYQSNLSWGYDQKDMLYARLPDAAAFEKLKVAMSQYSLIDTLAGSADHLGKQMNTVVIHLPDAKQYEVDQLSVDAGYFNTLRLHLKEGRVFRPRSDNDRKTVVINELMAENFELKNPVGALITIDSIKYEIIGVVQDFHSKSFFNKMKPTLFRMADEKDLHYLSLRTTPGTAKSAYAHLQAEWVKHFPEAPFDGGFQEDVWGIYFQRVDRSEQFSNIVAGIAVLLACMGLYGLVTINVSGRSKEFSIRRILGAGIKNVSAAIFKEYIGLIIAALLIGIPVSYIFSKAYLSMLFAYPMPMNYSGILIAAVILLAIVVAVISTQINKILHHDPVEGLKSE